MTDCLVKPNYAAGCSEILEGPERVFCKLPAQQFHFPGVHWRTVHSESLARSSDELPDGGLSENATEMTW